MKKFILGFLLASATVFAATEFSDLTVIGNITSYGLSTLDGGTVKLHEINTNGGSKVTLQTVANLTADYSLTLPPDDGDPGYVLTTDGSGTLTWEAGGAGSVTASSTTTFTNKTIDADGTGNVISNIENADIKAAAGIAVNKLAALTASRVAVSDGSGFLTTGNVDTTELLLLDGVTGVLTTNAGTQTLTNKTLTSPIVGTTATFENNASAQFFEATGGGSSKVTVAAPAALAGDVTFTLPGTNGSSGQYLKTDGSGVLSWDTPAGGSSSAGLYCKIKWGYAVNANWVNASGTFAIPVADTDYPAPTVTTTTLGSAAGITCSAPGTKVPTLVTANLPAGEYKVVMSIPGYGDSTQRCYTRVTDGTDSGDVLVFGSNGSTNILIPAQPFLDIVYGSTVSKDFSLQLASGSGTGSVCYIYNGLTSLVETTFYLYRVR